MGGEISPLNARVKRTDTQSSDISAEETSESGRSFCKLISDIGEEKFKAHFLLFPR